MMKVKGIFAVSLIAMVAVVAGTHTSNAVAAIASQGYVDQQVGLKANATDLEAKVDIYQGGSAANKAVITNASGNITTGTISSAMITDGTITNADIANNAAIETSKVSGLAKVATSGLYGDLTGKPTIPTVNNATLTIQKNGATVDTFTANASADKTINITVPTATSQLTNDSNFITAEQLPDEYTLPVATESALGGVKSGGSITVDTSGTVTVNSAGTATNAKFAAFATNDEEGSNIKSTYATKAQLTALDSTSSGTGAVVTDVSQTDGKVSVTKGNVKIPVGGENATSYATIWVQ